MVAHQKAVPFMFFIVDCVSYFLMPMIVKPMLTHVVCNASYVKCMACHQLVKVIGFVPLTQSHYGQSQIIMVKVKPLWSKLNIAPKSTQCLACRTVLRRITTSARLFPQLLLCLGVRQLMSLRTCQPVARPWSYKVRLWHAGRLKAARLSLLLPY